ncbi:MAG: LysE family translocator [Pseudomonadota bacterium]
MPLDLWLAFVAASTALLLIPGPTILLVLSYALSQGRRVAVATATGVALGDLIAMTAALAGLGAIIAASATAFTLLKWVGAAYLVYLGIQMLLSAPGRATLAQAPATEPRAILRHAAIVTALNPKGIGFFIAFVPQFISPAQPFAPQAAILIATFVGLAAVNALAYALAADLMRARIARPSVIRRLTQAGGATLIAMGALTATLRRTPG